MRKSKKLLGIALVPCMVGSLLAGCTASSEDVRKSIEEEDDETTAGKEKNTEDDVAETEPGQIDSDEEPDDSDVKPDDSNQAAAFVDLLRGISDMEAYSMDTEITVNQIAADGEETEVKLNVKALTDGKGNVSLTVGADFDDEDLGIAVNGDLLTISKVDDRMYVDMTGTYDIVMDTLGEDSQYVEQYADAFDITMDELESLLVLGIPVGDLDISKSTYTDMEEALDLIYADMEVAIDSLGEDFMTQEGNTYILTVNNDNLIDVADAFIDAFEGNMDEIYDAYIDALKKTNYTDQLETVLKAIVDEVIEGVEAAADTEISKEERAALETEIEDALEEIQDAMDEMIEELENGKDDFLDEFESAIEEYRDEKENIRSTIEDSENTIEGVLKVTSEGKEGSRTITCEMTTAAKSADDAETVTIGIKSVIEEGDVTITAPKKYSTLSKAIELAYRVYTIYEETAQDNSNYNYDDDDYNYDDDDYYYDDDDWNTDTYTQEELADIYGVTLKDNQAIASYSTDLDAVLITAYDDMEFYEPDDMDNFQMEQTDSAFTYITVVVYDSSVDKEYVEDAYDGKELDDNMYYTEDEDELNLYIFEKDITINIEFETYEDLEDYTNGDGEAFMLELADLCEIIPAQ